uniref:stathmin domain-containing protein 1 n=1 Tax=Semicossyphus pulcher TaxID=241346 RepID=UPI0037E80BBF
MGCASSSNTAVHPLGPEEVKRDEDETASKLDGRGDSAVSKVTTDSGVVMDSRDVSDLPGAVPRKLPPLSRVGESETDRYTQDGSLQQESRVQERRNSSDILGELLLQGIIPAGQSRERGGGTGEAYSIMLGDSEGVMRRPPARLESLKEKAQNLPSREEIEEKMRLADERRKLKKDELKTRLRSKSARVRGPAPTSSTDEDVHPTPVETLQSPLTPHALNPPPHSQIPREEAEGGEWVREVAGDGRESKQDTGKADRREEKEEGEGRGDNKDAKRAGDGEELTQVEELKEEPLLTASAELECDSSFLF